MNGSKALEWLIIHIHVMKRSHMACASTQEPLDRVYLSKTLLKVLRHAAAACVSFVAYGLLCPQVKRAVTSFLVFGHPPTA